MINFDKWEKLRAGHTAKPKEKLDYFYYDPSSGNGDWAYNTCREILDRGDRDEWSHTALEGVFETLAQGKRWPTYAAPYIDPGLYEQQFRMTQDPWLLAYCCAVHLNRIDLIAKYKPKFWLFLPDKWAWRRSLLSKPNSYWLWRRFPHTLLNNIRFKIKGKTQVLLQDFVYVFYGYMEKAYIDQYKIQR